VPASSTSGVVDIGTIPAGLIERVDVVTGGASAVYGSDAISGLVNFIFKRNFEGVELDTGYSQTGDKDGATYRAALTIGANVAEGRGNVAMSLGYSKREPVLLGDRAIGQVGIVTATGGGLGVTSPPHPVNCGGPGSVPTTFGGSSTTIPSRIALVGVPAATGAFQVREDRTLGPNCSVFNFNPFNYYQTPAERFSATAVGHYEINENVEAYARTMFTRTNVRQQIAPSGIFGNAFFVPLSNPFLSASQRTTLITAANAARTAGTLTAANFRDLNANGTIDAADDLNLVIRRRTVELGPRSSSYETNYYQMVFGLRGDNAFGLEDWSWDASLQRGESSRTEVRAGYTNVTNFGNALNAVSTTSCRTGGSACVPIDIFGPFGAITPAAAAYSGAVGILQSSYVQQLASVNLTGPIPAIQSPLAAVPLAVSVGAEYREEFGRTEPDECLKLAPTSCLGGAGGNTLPIAGGYSVYELFGEAIFQLAADQSWAKSLDIEVGYRFSDYDPSGVNKTWKYGVNWEPMEGLRFRAMQQRAARAPNIGELAAPLVSGLRNATFDPCSSGNTAPISAALRALCISTGQTTAQVGTIQDIVSGQVSTFEGTNLARLPKPEKADTTTIGVVWQPTFMPTLRNLSISVDYYRIKIDSPIGIFQAQEVLDDCYIAANTVACANIVRVNGDIASPASGIQLFTTNLKRLEAEGIEGSVAFGVDMTTFGLDEKWGSLAFQWTGNYYLTNESQSGDATKVIDCVGFFSTQCDPTPEFRFVQRTSWNIGDLQLSYLWRYVGKINVAPNQEAVTFLAFRSIEAHNYFDLSASYAINDTVRVSAGVRNVFENDAPVVGNEAGTTSANSGNTFPSGYDVLGRVFSVGLNLRF
ncbi:TonB-dependent receptor domain-containing protein, partial [Phenylobacterium sp.]|uniref:TonB-dependent receptor domain-containing protein n=1 Tax=Phenylobacterium sp. TaxID=1871053 RepID=UPI0039837674